MQKKIFVYLTACLSLFAAFSMDAMQYEPQILFDLDPEVWKLDYQFTSPEASIKEFVLHNENVNNWTELVTIQTFPYMSMGMTDYYRIFLDKLKDSAPNSKVESMLISKSEDSLFIEWWINDKSSDAQHEWLKLLRDNKNTYVVRYTTRKMDVIDTKRFFWEKQLGAVRLAPEKMISYK